MSSVSATHLILFIASMIIAVGIAGVLVGEVGNLSDAIEDRGSGVSEEIETEVVIVSDEGQPGAIYDDTESNATILVKNVGSTDLQVDPSVVDVMIDGRYVPNDDLAVARVDVEGSDTWRPGGVVEITATNQTLDGDTELTVIVAGNEDSIHIHAKSP